MRSTRGRVRRRAKRAGREVQDRLDAGGDHLVDHALRRIGRYRNHGNPDLLFRGDAAELLDVENRHAEARLLSHLIRQRVEERDDLEALLAESGVIGQREPEIAGAQNGDFQLALQAKNLTQVALQVLHVITNAADAELAEVCEIFPDLRRVQVKLLRKRLRRYRLHACRIERIQATQIHR